MFAFILRPTVTTATADTNITLVPWALNTLKSLTLSILDLTLYLKHAERGHRPPVNLVPVSTAVIETPKSWLI